MKREIMHKLAELRKEVDKFLSKGLSSSNKFFENGRNKENDSSYIALTRYKAIGEKGKYRNKTKGSLLVKELKEMKDINLNKFIYMLAGISLSRWRTINSESSTKYISVAEANTIGSICGIDGVQFFKNCKIIDTSNPIKASVSGYKPDVSLVNRIKDIDTFKEALGINDQILRTMEVGGLLMRKELARYIVDVICIIDGLDLSDKEREEYVKKHQEKSTQSIISSILTPNAYAIIEKKKSDQIKAEEEQKAISIENNKNEIIEKLLDDLDKANQILSIQEFKIVESYISGLRLSKESRDALIKNSYLEVLPETIPEAKETISYKEVGEDVEREQNIEEAIALYEEGYSLKDCADLLETSISDFRSILQDKGVEIKKHVNPNTFSQEFQNVYWNYVGKSISAQDAANQLGITLAAFYGRYYKFKKKVGEENAVK